MKENSIGFLMVLLTTMEAFTLALWINQPDRLGSLIWALPIITCEATTALFVLTKWRINRS